MKKQSGFTLIELVVVIIILSILAAVAIPKFIALQSDARVSALLGLKGALDSAASLTYSRAAIDREEVGDTYGRPSDYYTVNGINIIYGYPEATIADLIEAAGLSTIDWDMVEGPNVVYINPAGGRTGINDTCKVIYREATEESRPQVYLSGGYNETADTATDVVC